MEILTMALALMMLVFWVVCNVYLIRNYTMTEMYEDLVLGQSKFGRLVACGFYSLAWVWKVMVA